MYKKSERAGPHPIGQKSQLVKRSLDTKSLVPDPESQIPNPRSQIPNTNFLCLEIFFWPNFFSGHKIFGIWYLGLRIWDLEFGT